MMNVKCWLFSIIGFTFSGLLAQNYDFSGEWKGTLYQIGKNAIRPSYVFQMSLIQEGNRVKGASYLQLPDLKEIYATMKLVGTIKGNTLYFEEVEILKEKLLQNSYFCLKKGTLFISEEKNNYLLKGDVTGTFNALVCDPGVVDIQKPKPIKAEIPKNTVKDSLVSLPMDIKKGEKITLKHIYFKSSSSELLPNSVSEMQKILQYLRANPSLVIQIQGHTDIGSTAAYNLQLSTERAKTVADWLIHYGIKAERLSYNGFGSTKPIADNTTPQGRALNRRIEFEVMSE